MHPMKLITYVLFFSVAMLVAMGGIGFYAGYSAGRGDLSEMKAEMKAAMKAFAIAPGSPENAAAMAEVLKQAGKHPAAEVNLNPVLEEIRTMAAQIDQLKQATANAAHTPAPAPVSSNEPKLKEELAAIKQRLSTATEQYNTCKQDLSLMQVKLETHGPNQPNTAAPAPVALTPPDAGRGNNPNAANAANSVVLYDNVLLKRDQNKLYSDVDVALSLQSVTSKSAKVIVNQQAVAIAFGERKIFQHRDVTCELQLRETDLEASQAKVSIACKR